MQVTHRLIPLVALLPMLAIASPCALAEAPQPADASPVSQLIDRQIERSLTSRKIIAAPRADQSELLRRIYLDLLGRIPTAAEAKAYFDDPSSEKHHRLIEALLRDEEMPVYWATVLDRWLCGSAMEREFGRDAFLRYLEDSLRENRGWDAIARPLIAPDLQSERERSAAYFLAVQIRTGDAAERIDNMTSAVSTGLFGIQLQCAKCHDHPFVEDIKQDHYYGLAAFLSRTQEAKLNNLAIVRERAEGEVTFTTTKKEERKAKLMFLDGHVVEEPPAPKDKNAWYAKVAGGLPETPYFSRRTALANYAINANSPRFKQAIVNRVWKQLMKRGLIEPVDQMHEANAASHPDLLVRLADDLAANHFDLRRLMAGIMHSDAYLRTSRWQSTGPRPSETDYAVAIVKPLSADQLALAIAVASGQYEQFKSKIAREKQSKPSEEIKSRAAIRRQHAKQRETVDFAARFASRTDDFDASAAQAMFLSYHSLMEKQLQIQDPTIGLVARLVKQSDRQAATQDLYLSILSRQPSNGEFDALAAYFSDSRTPQEEAWRDYVWALLCSAEFRFNH